MQTATNLHDLLTGVLFDDGVRAAFRADPSGFLRANGYEDLDVDDVEEAILLMADELPPAQAEVLIDAGGPVEVLPGLDGAANGLGLVADMVDEQGAAWLEAGVVDSIVDLDDVDFGAGGAPEPGVAPDVDGEAIDDGVAAEGLGDDPGDGYSLFEEPLFDDSVLLETDADVDAGDHTAAESVVDEDPFDFDDGPGDGFDDLDPTVP